MPLATIKNNQSNSWFGKHITSVQEVFEALTYLNMPLPSQEAIDLIAAGQWRGKFKHAIEECVKIDGKEPDPEVKRYLFGLVMCISKNNMQVVNGLLGYKNVPLEAFVLIGHECGIAFYAAVKGAMDSNDENHSSGKDIVQEKLEDAMKRLGGRLEPPVPVQIRAQPIRNGATTKQRPVESDQHYLNIREDETKEEFLSTHAYAGKAALCFNACTSRDGHFTVIVDGAASAGERSYDWKNAIKIQLGHKELPILYGVLIGWQKAAKFDAHGATNDKTFEIERQEGKIFVKMYAKDQPARAVPIGPMDVYPILNVVLAQIIKEAPPEIRDHPNIIINQMKLAQSITVELKP